LFYWLCRAVAHVFGDQVFAHFKLPHFGFSLAFGHLVELFVFSSFSFAQVIRVLVLPMPHQGGDCEHKVEICPCDSICDE
jgi:hypothetical protein